MCDSPSDLWFLQGSKIGFRDDQDPLCDLLAGLTTEVTGPVGKEATGPAARSPFFCPSRAMLTLAWTCS